MGMIIHWVTDVPGGHEDEKRNREEYFVKLNMMKVFHVAHGNCVDKGPFPMLAVSDMCSYGPPGEILLEQSQGI
jgi:hypothetical protein